MPLSLRNTLTNKREPFTPLHPQHITMYVCGPTVYGPVHIGNARPAVVFDVLYRLLQRRYPKVTYARNITDIDDKIIAAAARENTPPAALAERWRKQYAEDMQKLGVQKPDKQPLATEHIADIIAIIRRLIAQGFAYENAGHVLFHVPAFPHYGALSNRRREEMLAGARVEVAPYKKDAADFVLWKPSEDGIIGWQSPWGRGRPGWHIECSAMAAACLGQEIDIHGGGQDLIFPHHENEIAQSRCAHAAPRFAKYWLHNGHVRMDGEKMSKSLNNVVLLRDILSQHAGETVRLALLSAHYRQPLNWNDALLTNARTVLDKWYRLLSAEEAEEINTADTSPKTPPANETDKHAEHAKHVEDALSDDLNTPAAIAALHKAAQMMQQSIGAEAEAHRAALRAGARMLGLLQHPPAQWFKHAAAGEAPASQSLSSSAIEEKIRARHEAKTRRDYAAADAIREELQAAGITLEDSPAGTTWRMR